MRVAIVGYGVEGAAAYRYFAAQGADIAVFHKERPADLPDGAEFVQEAHATELEGFDIVVRSPAVRPDSLRTSGRITTVTREFFAVFGHQRIIGVTGSKGKGTISALLHEMLKAAGKRVHLGGNIGVPALDLLPDVKDGDYVVLELSSFQLWDLEASPHIAVVGMITPDHLDVHKDFEEYLNAKATIARYQTPEDIIVYHPTNKYAKQIAELSRGKKLRYDLPEAAHIEGNWFVIEGRRICKTAEAQIPGRHNLENICAALTAAWQVAPDVEALARAIREYKGLPHRIEFVRNVDGVDYYDDSFAASTSAAVVAAQAFEAPKVLILGGYDRGVDLEPMVKELSATNLRKVLLIGQTAPRLAELFEAAGQGKLVERLAGHPTMTEIVGRARELAQKGDVVALSPGSASFDMFKDYKDRGDQFKKAVWEL